MALSHDNERDSYPHDDQRIYGTDHDAEINVDHDAFRWELGLIAGHCTSHRILSALEDFTREAGIRSSLQRRFIRLFRWM